MDILFLLASKDFGGAEAYVEKIIKKLHGVFEFSIACPYELRHNERFMYMTNSLGVPVFYYNRRYPYSVRSMIEFRKILKTVRPRLLHANMNWIGNCSSELSVASCLNQPYIMTQHIVPPVVKLDFLRKSIIKTNILQAQGIVCVSEYTKENVLRFLGQSHRPIQVIYNGIDISSSVSECKRDRCNDEVRFVTVARLTPQKGISYLLRAISQASVHLSGVQFIVAGDGELRAELEGMARELNIDSFVSFLGFQRDVHSLLHESDVFVLPSIEEGFPFAILEAMEAGLPVLATNVGGNRELISHNENGILVPARNIESMSRELIRLAGDRSLRRQLGDAGRDTVKKQFNSKQMMKQLKDIYECLI